MVSLVRGMSAEDIEKRRRKWTHKKKLNNEENKNEEQKESQITLMNIFGFTFYIKKHILFENIV